MGASFRICYIMIRVAIETAIFSGWVVSGTALNLMK